MQQWFNTSDYAKIADLASLKTDVEKLYIDKSKTTFVDIK